MFAKTKTFSPMRTLEFGFLLSLISFVFLICSVFAQSADTTFKCGIACVVAGFTGCILFTMDPRFLKEDWEVKEIEERWAEKKRAREQRRLQKQNGKAKH